MANNPTIPFYVHRCLVRQGSMAGNTFEVQVDDQDILYGNCCQNCGDQLATPEQAIAHVYGQLTQGA